MSSILSQDIHDYENIIDDGTKSSEEDAEEEDDDVIDYNYMPSLNTDMDNNEEQTTKVTNTEPTDSVDLKPTQLMHHEHTCTRSKLFDYRPTNIVIFGLVAVITGIFVGQLLNVMFRSECAGFFDRLSPLVHRLNQLKQENEKLKSDIDFHRGNDFQDNVINPAVTERLNDVIHNQNSEVNFVDMELDNQKSIPNFKKSQQNIDNHDNKLEEIEIADDEYDLPPPPDHYIPSNERERIAKIGRNKYLWNGFTDSPISVIDNKLALPEYCYSSETNQDELFDDYYDKKCQMKENKLSNIYNKLVENNEDFQPDDEYKHIITEDNNIKSVHTENLLKIKKSELNVDNTFETANAKKELKAKREKYRDSKNDKIKSAYSDNKKSKNANNKMYEKTKYNNENKRRVQDNNNRNSNSSPLSNSKKSYHLENEQNNYNSKQIKSNKMENIAKSTLKSTKYKPPTSTKNKENHTPPPLNRKYSKTTINPEHEFQTMWKITEDRRRGREEWRKYLNDKENLPKENWFLRRAHLREKRRDDKIKWIKEHRDSVKSSV